MQSRVLDPREGLVSGQLGRSHVGTGGREGGCPAGWHWEAVGSEFSIWCLPLPRASQQPPSPPNFLQLTLQGSAQVWHEALPEPPTSIGPVSPLGPLSPQA